MGTYQPTGKPPGRPRKDGLPAGSVSVKAEPEPEVKTFSYKVMRSPFDARPVRDPADSNEVCPQCFPDLVGSHPRNVISCKHGTYYGD